MVQFTTGDPSFQSTFRVTPETGLLSVSESWVIVATPVALIHDDVYDPWGAVTSRSTTDFVAVLPGLRPTTARTLTDAVPGVVETVGAQEVVVTVVEDRVVPPLVRLTRYDVALATAFHGRGDVVAPVGVGGGRSGESGRRGGRLARHRGRRADGAGGEQCGQDGRGGAEGTCGEHG